MVRAAQGTGAPGATPVDSILGVVALVGAPILVFAILWGARSIAFEATASRTDGTIVGVWTSARASSTDRSVGRHPIVEYQVGGRTITSSADGHLLPFYDPVGDRATVLYQPSGPHGARLRSGLYGPPLGVGIVGASCLAPWFMGRQRRRLRERVRAEGRTVVAKVTKVWRTKNRVNELYAWQMQAEYRDGAAAVTHVFVSHNIWAEVGRWYPDGSDVTVTYLPDRPRACAFHLDDLPYDAT